MCFFFFFKQKTAYEMRISDWSSDVCSSDLLCQQLLHRRHGRCREQPRLMRVGGMRHHARHRREAQLLGDACPGHDECRRTVRDRGGVGRRDRAVLDERSEEHTSELQSLMRISYAVFCLKNKTNTYKQDTNSTQ